MQKEVLTPDRIQRRTARREAAEEQAEKLRSFMKQFGGLGTDDVVKVMALAEVLQLESRAEGDHWVKLLIGGLLSEVVCEGLDHVLNRPSIVLALLDEALEEMRYTVEHAHMVVDRHPNKIDLIDFSRWWEDVREREKGMVPGTEVVK